VSNWRFRGSAAGRHRLAQCLVVTVLALSVFSVSHVHGVSDPHTHHSLLDFLIFAQAQTGFLIAVLVWILFVLATLGLVRGGADPAWSSRTEPTLRSRAPPSLP
jgi:predicted cobalt transporter CbtA